MSVFIGGGGSTCLPRKFWWCLVASITGNTNPILIWKVKLGGI